MKRIYRKGTLIYIKHPDGREHRGHAMTVLIYKTHTSSEFFHIAGIGGISSAERFKVGEIADEEGTPYTDEGFNAFAEENTGIVVNMTIAKAIR